MAEKLLEAYVTMIGAGSRAEVAFQFNSLYSYSYVGRERNMFSTCQPSAGNVKYAQLHRHPLGYPIREFLNIILIESQIRTPTFPW